MQQVCFRIARPVLPLLLLALSIGSLNAGCNETAKQASQPPPSQPQLTQQMLLPSNAPAGASAGQPTALAPAQQQQASGLRSIPAPTPPQPVMNIPVGARWTIFCYAVKGPGHVADSRGTRDKLNASSGRSDWYVIHGQDTSNIYFGFYRAVEEQSADKADAVEAKRAHVDLDWVRAIRALDKSLPFERSLFVALDSPNPTAPPEWDLFNVDRQMNPQDPKRAFWSLQIMAFKAHPLRKEAAVQAVADLRAKGIEAYYYHGDVVSSVTVGKWQYDAVKPQNRTDEFKDVAGAAAGTPMAVTNFPLTADEQAKPIDGKTAVSVSPKLEVQDRSMLATMAKFPTHAVNYEIGILQGNNGQKIEESSFLVEIPRAKGNSLFDTGGAAPVVRDNGSDWGRRHGTSMINPTPAQADRDGRSSAGGLR